MFEILQKSLVKVRYSTLILVVSIKHLIMKRGEATV